MVYKKKKVPGKEDPRDEKKRKGGIGNSINCHLIYETNHG
jgi:hypothetical protein